MRRVLYVLVVSISALTSAVRSQTSVSTRNEPQPVKAIEDCACESQVLPDALAIVNGVRITARDIEKATGDSVRQLQRQVIEARKRELALLINSRLLSVEAKKRGISTTKLLEQEVVAKVQAPLDTEIQTFYEQNKARIQGDFQDAREEILRYLLDQRQRLEAKKFADTLRKASETKIYIAEFTPPRNEAERAVLLATVNGEKITSGDVEDLLKPIVFNVQESVYKLRKDELDLSVNDTLLIQEAHKRQLTTNALLDVEVKPKAVTEEQARAFFEQNKDRVSGDFAQTRDSIIGYLEQIEVRVAERAFVEKLRAAASIQTFLVVPESPVFSVSTVDQPSLGRAEAPVTLVIFMDYQCPSCAAIHSSLERLVKEYGDKVRLVTRDFPLPEHSEAFKAAEAAEAAREQGRYWEYAQLLMRNQSALSVDNLKVYASDLALNRPRFDSALDSGKFAEMVQRDIEEGIKLGINATPTVFINGRRVSAKSYDELKANVEAAFKALPQKEARTMPMPD